MYISLGDSYTKDSLLFCNNRASFFVSAAEISHEKGSSLFS